MPGSGNRFRCTSGARREEQRSDIPDFADVFRDSIQVLVGRTARDDNATQPRQSFSHLSDPRPALSIGDHRFRPRQSKRVQ
jgi:hypothetical protein